MKIRIATLIACFALCASSFAATPGSGQASGPFVVNGKPLTLKYAVAVSGPDTFDETKEALTVILTAKPLPRATIDGAKDLDDLRNAVKEGLVYKIRKGEGFHLTFRHPALGHQELQTSGPDTTKDLVIGADSVSGTIKPWMGDGDEEKIMSETVRYNMAFNAPIARRFPLEKPIVLGANAKSLGAGGGEPGKAYLEEKCKPVVTDAKTVEAKLKEAGALPSDKDLAEMSKKAGHKITREEFIQQMADLAKAMAPLGQADCKVLGGKSDGAVAILQVEATTLGSRMKTDITLVKEGAKWKVAKEGAWSAVATK